MRGCEGTFHSALIFSHKIILCYLRKCRALLHLPFNKHPIGRTKSSLRMGILGLRNERKIMTLWSVAKRIDEIQNVLYYMQLRNTIDNLVYHTV